MQSPVHDRHDREQQYAQGDGSGQSELEQQETQPPAKRVAESFEMLTRLIGHRGLLVFHLAGEAAASSPEAFVLKLRIV